MLAQRSQYCARLEGVRVYSVVRRGIALAIASVFMLSQARVPSDARAVPLQGLPPNPHHFKALPQPQHAPPQRIAVPQPQARARMPRPAAASIRAVVSHDVRVAHGAQGRVPRMLGAREIDRVLSAARERAARSLPPGSQRAANPAMPPATPPMTRVVAPVGSRTGGAAPVRSSVRATQSVQGGTGTGINPWWRYAAEKAASGGEVMVNVGTGNLLLQEDDMTVPHKGLSLAFRRTYNSQSLHDAAGTDGAQPSMYGNGWTNSFDAHITGSSTGTINVWDIDGARYDYTLAADGVTRIAPPGQHATLVSDGGCGYLWTKKSGTSYYFWTPDGAGSCASWWFPSYGAYAGRLYQLIGRNRNTSITFVYSWDNGNSAVGGKISAISAQTESGLTANLSFADVSGHRLLQSITYPDGMTSTVYGYDAVGNLTSVGEPAYDGAGDRSYHGFGYQTVGTGTTIYWASSPRWNGTDGAYTVFGIGGSSPASSTVNGMGTVAVMNPTIPDGTGSGALQSGYNTSPDWVSWEYYATGIANPWAHDTNGHGTNWVVDSLSRPTQTQECTVMSGWTCSGPWLVSNETWDASNNLASEVDPRGNETDYIYDPAGNTTAIGEPLTATSDGTFKPVKIFDYDAYNNVVAYCDESESRAAGANWVAGVASVNASDSLCATHGGSAHYHAAYSYPSYEPYGELQSMTTPMGYTRTISYAPAQQAGMDFGLPTSVTGTSFTQIDGTANAANQTIWYDAAGNVRCTSGGQGTTVLTYDALGRIISVADPDDSSANASSLCGKSTGQPGWNTQTTYGYFANGMVASTQTPAERAGGVATTFTYDADGNATTETRHYACVPGGSCTPGVTTKWYDGADRLVEVGLPHDPSDYYASTWLTRYFYDLSAGGTVSVGGTYFRAYGNVFKTQEWVPPSAGASPSWRDLRGAAYDALDRVVAKYTFSPSSNTTVRATTLAYDTAAATLGLLASTTDPLGETTTYAYDAAGHQTTVQFSGDGGITPNKSFVYDAMGRMTSATGAVYGTETTRYDGDGRVAEVDEPTTGSITSPAHITYDYYPDGTRKDVNVASSALNAAPLMSYAYRADGKRRMVHVGWGQQQGNFTTTYTDAGRTLSRSDPFTGSTMPSPRSPVAPGTAFVPTTWAYDTAGQIASKQLPQTFAYQAIGHDDESLVTKWTGSNSSNGPVTNTFVNTNRGENIYQSIGSATAASYDVHIANGAAVRAQHYTIVHGAPPPTGVATSVDPTNAVVASTSKDVYAASLDPDMPGWVNCGNQIRTNDYDAASRLVSTTTTLTGLTGAPECADFDGSPNVEPLYAYDAENHHISAATLGASQDVQWSPTGHAYTFATTLSNVHYDGGQILFVTDQNGALTQAKVETLGDIDGTGQLTVLDRDFADHYVARHNNTVYGGIWLGATIYSNSSTPPTSIPYVFWGSTNDTSCSATTQGGSCGGAGSLEYGRLEGFEYGRLTFQGARAVDSSSGQWTTPDAYAGAVHDPMSQKAFMWDRNNAYSYSDPSGFAPSMVATADTEGGWTGKITSAGNSPAASAGEGGATEVAMGVTAADALAAVLKTIIGLAINETVYGDGLKPGEAGFMDAVAGHITSDSPFKVSRPNGNIAISQSGVNAQVYTSTKVLQSGVVEITIQVNITGGQLGNRNYSNRYGVDGNGLWKALRPEGAPRTFVPYWKDSIREFLRLPPTA